MTLTEETIIEVLKEVIDPEIGVNIVDLGLVYNVAINGGRVDIRMTLTAPGCPMSETIARTAEMAAETVDGVEDAHIEMVWDPPWTPERLTDEGRRLLGF